MNFTVYVRRAAELDVAEAQIWYEEQQAGLAAQFHHELSVVITRLADTPLIYPVVSQHPAGCVASLPVSGLVSCRGFGCHCFGLHTWQTKSW
ncbi:MAG TPA: hypothetical protein VIJ25_16110 [Methylococcales bacterium]